MQYNMGTHTLFNIKSDTLSLLFITAYITYLSILMKRYNPIYKGSYLEVKTDVIAWVAMDGITSVPYHIMYLQGPCHLR